MVAATEAVRRGELVVLPTDTAYGVGVDAFTPWAVERLRAARGMQRGSPVSVLVGTVRAATALVDDFGPFGQDLIDQFWPGGLTLVARATPTLAWDLGETRGTVAVRMPLHAAALDLLKKTGPMAVSSANTTGRPAATTADEAMEQLGDSVSVYLDGGPCGGGVASTIIDLTGSVPRLLRAGAISMDRLREVAALVTGEEVTAPASANGTAGLPGTSPALPDGPPGIPSDSPADARADALASSAASTPEVPAGEPEAPAEKLMQDAAEGQQAADDPTAPVTSESATAAPATPQARKPASPRKPATRKTPASTRKPAAGKTRAPKTTDEHPAGEDAAGEPAKTTGKAATNRKPAAERTTTRKPAAERAATRRTAARNTTPADPPTLGDQTDTASQPGGTQPGGPG
jgi:L-threonylcarbamoyladenylate synthase